MSFPRNTDVSKHMARKPHQSAAPVSESVPAGDSANTELESLTEDLSAAVNSAQNTHRQADDQ